MSEAWEGGKFLHELDEDLATPMIMSTDRRIFFVKELVKCTRNRWFWPRRWILGPDDEMFADGDSVSKTEVCERCKGFDSVLSTNSMCPRMGLSFLPSLKAPFYEWR